jgi:hypothetical protein
MSTFTTEPPPRSARPHATDQPRAHAAPSISDIFKQLRDEMLTLFRQEIALVRTETGEMVKQAAKDAAKVPAGGVIALVGVTLSMIALAIFLSWGLFALGLPLLAAAGLGFLILGLLTTAVGYGLLKSGAHRLVNEDLTPHRTLKSVQENKDWIKEKTS